MVRGNHILFPTEIKVETISGNDWEYSVTSRQFSLIEEKFKLKSIHVLARHETATGRKKESDVNPKNRYFGPCKKNNSVLLCRCNKLLFLLVGVCLIMITSWGSELTAFIVSKLQYR